MKISELYKAIHGAVPATGVSDRQNIRRPGGPAGPSEFDRLLENQRITLSKHAVTRIRSRSIPWNGALEKRIGVGMAVAEKKGSQSALILADELAEIANVKSRAVVTAIDKSELKERVF